MPIAVYTLSSAFLLLVTSSAVLQAHLQIDQLACYRQLSKIIISKVF